MRVFMEAGYWTNGYDIDWDSDFNISNILKPPGKMRKISPRPLLYDRDWFYNEERPNIRKLLIGIDLMSDNTIHDIKAEDEEFKSMMEDMFYEELHSHGEYMVDPLIDEYDPFDGHLFDDLFHPYEVEGSDSISEKPFTWSKYGQFEESLLRSSIEWK